MQCDVLVIGAGSIGVSTAYFLKQQQPQLNVLLIDSAAPLTFTSAQSGENYRNWWPHPIMKQFMDRSITLMEGMSAVTGNAIQLTQRGYLLATRNKSPDELIDNLTQTYTETDAVRWHTAAQSYQATQPDASTPSLQITQGLDGVDIVNSASLIRQLYPQFDPAVETIIHIRRGGMLSAQQMGAYMLESFKAAGGQVLLGQVEQIHTNGFFGVEAQATNRNLHIAADALVNTAGPFASDIAAMLSVTLPVSNVLQQKIAFEDTHGAIERQMPFAIDLDEQCINWSEDERELLASEPALQHLLGSLTGSIHCRPEGGDQSRWIKLGWAFNNKPAMPQRSPQLDDYFPEIVLRGAMRLNPALSVYLDGFPRNFTHYGGYYTLTDENWPLIGETDVPGFYVATAMSGFGTMAACAAGELVAQHVTGAAKPEYADALSLKRYHMPVLMQEIEALQSRGIL